MDTVIKMIEENYYNYLALYLHKNGEKIDDKHISIESGPDGTIITKWNFQTKKPDAKDLLKMTIDEVNEFAALLLLEREDTAFKNSPYYYPIRSLIKDMIDAELTASKKVSHP
jgi:hypothetical protein